MNQNDQSFLIQKIRTQYTEKQITGLDSLKALDAKVKRPAVVFASIFGSIGAIVMGCGMSLVMAPEFGAFLGMTETMLPGIVIGLIGMLLVIVNYPLYRGILGSRRKKYADQIMKLSDELLSKQ